MGSGAKYLKKEREKIKAREEESPPLLFIAFFTSHRSPLSERLEQATLSSVERIVGHFLSDPGPMNVKISSQKIYFVR